MSAEKKVVVSLGKRKRFVSFTSSDKMESDKDIVLERIREEFKDKLPRTDNYEIVLQMKNQVFDQFIEVGQDDEIEDKAVLEFFIEENEVSGLY